MKSTTAGHRRVNNGASWAWETFAGVLMAPISLLHGTSRLAHETGLDQVMP